MNTRRGSAAATAAVIIALVMSGCSLFSDSPEDVLTDFASALTGRDVNRAADATDDPEAARKALSSMFDGVGTKAKLSAAGSLVDDKKVTGTIRYRWDFGHDRGTGYETSATLVEKDSGWKVQWAPTVLHRNLGVGETFSFSDDRAYRTPVLDRNGRPLMTWQTVSLINLDRTAAESADRLARALAPVEPGITGTSIRADLDGKGSGPVTVIRLRAADMARVGRAVRAVAGVTVSEQGALLSATRALHSPAMAGLEEIWRQAIDATAGWSLSLVNADGTPSHLVGSAEPKPTPAIRTSLDRDVQTHAQEAADSQRKPTAVVAIEPSTGGILAVAQNSAADRSGPIALTGLYPPGSTFKTVTTAASLKAGIVQPDSPVACPGRATIEGRTIPNEDDFALGTVSLQTAFARSCNTTMGALANRLPEDALTTMARSFGIGADFVIPGITTVTGSAPRADTPALRVENGIGQGTVTVSPFGLALTEASLAKGSTVTPQLINGRPTTGDTDAQPLPADVVRELRTMMRATVTQGTATALRDIPGLGGKTGTAEYGDNSDPHGWFAGIVGDVAFATLVVGGGSSAPAISVTGEFLRPLAE